MEKEPCGDCNKTLRGYAEKCIVCNECGLKLCYQRKRPDYHGYLCSPCWVKVRNENTTC